MLLRGGREWCYQVDVSLQPNFAVWVLMRDGLEVPPFDRHTGGDRTVRSAGLNAARWWRLAIGEAHFPRRLEQRLEELAGEYAPVFAARRMALVPPHDPQLWGALAPYRSVLEPFDVEIVDYPWPVVHAISARKALITATGPNPAAWRERVLRAADQMVSRAA
jgi:hypothetical protein